MTKIYVKGESSSRKDSVVKESNLKYYNLVNAFVMSRKLPKIDLELVASLIVRTLSQKELQELKNYLETYEAGKYGNQKK